MCADQLIDIKDKLWNGSINIKVEYDIGEKTFDYIFVAWRLSYFSLYFEQIARHFEYFEDGISKRPFWLQHDKHPVEWHLPIGLLYDTLASPQSVNKTKGNVWKLQLKTSEYPMNKLIPFLKHKPDETIDFEHEIRQCIVNRLKQSCFVLNGSSKKIMQLGENDSNNLWTAIKTHDLLLFSLVNHKIIPRESEIQKIPFVIYIPGYPLLQVPVSLNTNERPTLGDTLSQNEVISQINSQSIQWVPFVHGLNIECMLNVDILTVWYLFRYLDNFIYLSITLK